MQELDPKRTVLLDKALVMFGQPAVAKKQHIVNKLQRTYDIDHVAYTDDMLRDLLNDVIYDRGAENLFTKYIVPPFSVLDTRQGYWGERKSKWLTLTGNLSATRDGEFGKVSSSDASADTMFSKINDGTSNFDPVLAELMVKWFCPVGGKILDPFGGEQTKGLVAGVLGYPYWGCEIRQEQVDLNKTVCLPYPTTNYVCGDSNDIDKLIGERNFDFVFTSPPYYDLEVYSASDLSSLGSYREFLLQLDNIYRQCVAMLANDRFFVVKVGEIRDKQTGEYRNFVGDTINILNGLGLKYYNELILVNNVGTAALRAGLSFGTRKMVKLHQNILVFYKGDLENIKTNFGAVDSKLPMPVSTQNALF